MMNNTLLNRKKAARSFLIAAVAVSAIVTSSAPVFAGTYTLPSKIGDGRISYKNGTVKAVHSNYGNKYSEVYKYKGKNKYSYKCSYYTATLHRKGNHIVKLTDDDGTIKYKYSKGSLIKITDSYTDSRDGKKCEVSVKIKNDNKKYPKYREINIKQGDNEPYKRIDNIKNTYKHGRLVKAVVKGREISPEGQEVEDSYTTKIKYKTVKMSAKEYKKIRPIVEYMMKAQYRTIEYE